MMIKKMDKMGVAFDDNLDGTYTVNIVKNLDDCQEYQCRYGVVEWDESQGLYVLWTGTSYSSADSGLETTSDEGVSYYDSLQETEDDIREELVDSLLNK